MANNLSKIRKALGLTQPKLADLMGTTKNQLIKLESGDRRLTQDWIEKAAKATGVAVEKFVMEGLTEADIRPATPEDSERQRPDPEAAQLLAEVQEIGLLDEVKNYMRFRLASGGTSGSPLPGRPDPTAPKDRKPR